MSEFCREASSKSRHHGEFWSKLKPLLPNTKSCKPNSTVLIENNQIFTQSIQYNTIQYNTIQYNTIQYNTIKIYLNTVKSFSTKEN